MKTKFYIRLVMLCASCFLFMGMAYAQQTHLEIPIVDGNDDAEEAKVAASGEGWEVEVGDVSRGSSDLELYWDDGAQFVGTLFRDVQIPVGATIDTAYIQFVCKSAGADDITIEIYGIDSVTVDSIQAAKYSISDKEPTEAKLDWMPDPWIVEFDVKEEQKTPDLKTIVDEIVGNPGWESGNNMMFVLTGDVEENMIRHAYSFDMDGEGPVLHVYFTEGSGTGTEEIQSDIRSRVYPNPAEGRLYIQNPSSDRFSYNIFNINGKLVASEQHIAGPGTDINLSDLARGVYFIKLVTTEQTETHKVILK